MSCIEYQGCKDSNGYGRRWHQGGTVLAHRLAYCTHHSISLASITGQVVRHTCDNPPCINPAHLVLGTVLDNVRDRVERRRSAALSGVGHPQSKLSDAEVAEIRARYAPRCKVNGGAALAREFGVAQQAISQVVNYKTRKPE